MNITAKTMQDAAMWRLHGASAASMEAPCLRHIRHVLSLISTMSSLTRGYHSKDNPGCCYVQATWGFCC